MNRKLIYTILGLCALLALMTLLFRGALHQTGTVKLTKVPSEMALTIDGKTASGSTFTLSTGTHKIAGKFDGFTDKTIKINVKSGQTITSEFFLDVKDNVGYAWLINHPLEGALTSGKSSKEFDKNSEKALKDTPFIRELPQYGPNFRIDYGNSLKRPTDSSAVAIYIQASTPIGRQNALDLIRQLTYDPSDMEIIFTSLAGN